MVINKTFQRILWIFKQFFTANNPVVQFELMPFVAVGSQPKQMGMNKLPELTLSVWKMAEGLVERIGFGVHSVFSLLGASPGLAGTRCLFQSIQDRVDKTKSDQPVGDSSAG